MKKVTILCMFILVMLTSVAFAENKIDTERWFWIVSNEEETIYIDKQTIEYDPATDSSLLWILRDIPNKTATVRCKIQVFYTQNKIKTMDYYIYEYGNSNPVETGVSNTIDTIPPDTMGEVLKNKSLTLINRDEELAKYKEQQEAEA